MMTTKDELLEIEILKASTSTSDTLSKIATALDVSILFLLDIKNPEYLEGLKKYVLQKYYNISL